MNTIGFAIGVAATGLAIAIVEHAPLQSATRPAQLADGCATSVTFSPGYLPRAALAIENRKPAPLRLRLEARPGIGLAAVDLGTIGAHETRQFRHVLPAGRNRLSASREAAQPATLRYIIDVTNRGAETCARRYLWRVD